MRCKMMGEGVMRVKKGMSEQRNELTVSVDELVEEKRLRGRRWKRKISTAKKYHNERKDRMHERCIKNRAASMSNLKRIVKVRNHKVVSSSSGPTKRRKLF